MDFNWTRSQYGSFSTTGLVIKKAHDTCLVSDKGDEYLDMNSGYWTAILGYSNPDLVSTLTRASERLSFCHNFEMLNTAGYRLYQAMQRATGLCDFRILWGCTGSDAIETALKFSFAHQLQEGNKSPQYHVIVFRRAYHGSTLLASELGSFIRWPKGTLSSNLRTYRVNPQPENPEVELDKVSEIFRVSSPWVFIFEPIQAARGITIPDTNLLQGIVNLCKERGTLVIADEITTGMGRTGDFLASHSLKPDVICLGKGLTGGYFPLSLCFASNRLMPHGEELSYGNTYAGHPVGCAVAERVIDIVQSPECKGRVQQLELTIRQGLNPLLRFPEVDRVTGRGAMYGVTFQNRACANEVAQSLLAQKIYTVVSGRCLMVMPAYNMRIEELKYACEVLNAVMEKRSRDMHSAFSETVCV